MARRKKKPAMPPAQPMMRTGNIRAELVAAEVDNPLYAPEHDGDRTNPRRIGAFVNIKESAITALAAKGALNAAQVAAAVRFRKLWERMGGSGAGAMDYGRVVVDGGKTPEPISAMQMEAGRELKEAQTRLKQAHGEYAYRLVGYICGQGYSIHDLCETRRQRDTMTDLLRMYLDVLADMWGLAGGRRRAG
jgi:hypothetical protein